MGATTTKTKAMLALAALATASAATIGALSLNGGTNVEPVGAATASSLPTTSEARYAADAPVTADAFEAIDLHAYQGTSSWVDATVTGDTLPSGERIQEDDERWDCATMGNLQCAPTTTEVPTTTSTEAPVPTAPTLTPAVLIPAVSITAPPTSTAVRVTPAPVQARLVFCEDTPLARMLLPHSATFTVLRGVNVLAYPASSVEAEADAAVSSFALAGVRCEAEQVTE